MANLIADIFVTVKPTSDRWESVTARSLRSLFANTDRQQYRLTLCIDGPIKESELEYVREWDPAYVLLSRENEGLGPTINRAMAHIWTMNVWNLHPTQGDPSKVAPFVCMCQDDLLYTKDWLPTLASKFIAYERVHKLGFASGIECVEHKVQADLGNGIMLKPWIRAANVLGRREYWQSMMPIPALDPETGRKRAKPNDGMGSGVDWWLIRNHENSVCRTGRTCLVMPGLLQHIGYNRSTWLSREMPESESDKERMR